MGRRLKRSRRGRRSKRSFRYFVRMNKLAINSILFLTIAIAISIYFIFYKPTTIKCGVVVEKLQTSNGQIIKVAQGDKIHSLRIKKKISVPSAEAYNATKKGIFTKSIEPCELYQERVLSKSSTELQLENHKLLIASDAIYYDKDIKPIKSKVILPGYSVYKFYADKDGKVGAIITGVPDISNVRVGISNNRFSSLDHGEILFSCKRAIDVRIKDASYKVPVNKNLLVKLENGVMNLYLTKAYAKDTAPDELLTSTKDRITLWTREDTYIAVPSLKRNETYTPTYFGKFEISMNGSTMNLINEVDIEDYLKFVVPSEIPSSGGLEGYKVQAIAARTYLLSDMLTGRFANKGFHVDDTTLSQVYNSQPTNELCKKAVDETKGLIMTYENNIIDAKYYSTSCGLGAPYNQIWYKNDDYKKANPKPYLSFNNFTELDIKHLNNEEQTLDFFKDWTIKSFDSFSLYYRWKYTFDIKNSINYKQNPDDSTNIYKLYTKNKDKFKVKTFLNFYKQAEISPNGLEDIVDIAIGRRGDAGNVMELLLITKNKTYKVSGELLIRNLLSPKEKGATKITPLYGSTMDFPGNLPSGFFAIDKESTKNGLKEITIYGGGYGHGVGMSQYGAIGLARQGKGYLEILNSFYKGVEISDYKNKVENILK